MKPIVLSLFVGIMALASGTVAAQDTTESEQVAVYSSNSPLLLLQDGNKTYKLNSDDISTINPEWVDKVQVLKQIDETEKFGEEGENGVVILTLNDGVKEAKQYLRQVRKKNEKVVNPVPKGVFRNR